MAKIETRYANALLELTGQSKHPESDLAQAALVRDALGGEDVRAFLTHPRIPKQAKYDLLRNSFSGIVSDHWLGFLQLMVRKNRVDYLLPALGEYIVQAGRRLGRTQASIISAQPLSPQQIESIRSVVARHVNMQVTIKTAVDPDVLGGFYVLADGHVFDATIRYQLNRLKEYLKKGGSYANQA